LQVLDSKSNHSNILGGNNTNLYQQEPIGCEGQLAGQLYKQDYF